MRPRAALVCAPLVLACASPQPVLYPNARYEAVGREVALVEVEECRVLAREAGATSGGNAEAAGELAKQTAGRAGAGAAAGAAGGAIRGNAGLGAAIGAASAAAWTFVWGGFRWLSGADRRAARRSLEQRFIERCLQDRGYDVIGWK